MHLARRTAAATAVLALLLPACMDDGETVPDAGDQESPAVGTAETE